MKLEISKNNGKLRVVSPYNACFISKAKKLGGKWDEGAWVFDVLAEEPLKSALLECYGTDGSQEPNVALKIKAKKELDEWHDSVSFGGIPVARAWGRDSGAKVCEDVIMVSGKITSGGSVKNWRTYVSEGSEFILTSVPKSILDKKDLWADDWEAEEYSQGPKEPDRKALEEELARLEARIAEIKQELEAMNA